MSSGKGSDEILAPPIRALYSPKHTVQNRSVMNPVKMETQKRNLSPVSDEEERDPQTPMDSDAHEIQQKQADDRDLFEAQRQAILQAQSQLAAVVNSAAAAGILEAYQQHPSLTYVPARHPMAQMFPTAVQTKPLSLKVEPTSQAPTANPPSGSSGLTQQDSPSTSSTEPEAEDLSVNNASPRDINQNSQGSSGQQNWSFEEQFKQLYELSDDPKRKEFLDELFSFMQKRGTPVTRIPIMAKQVLDLFELYRLVVANGGLVEVINKKLWREITKGLNLPSSITSAAFTLRTQYMKYLYPYECEKEKLSSPAELQAAIDGNRREGRRAGFNPYAQISPSMLNSRHLNGSGLMSGMDMLEDDEGLQSPPGSMSHPVFAAAAYREQTLALEAAQRQLERTQSAFRAVADQQQRHSQTTSVSGRASTSSNESPADSPAPPPAKRPAVSEEPERFLNAASINFPSAHIKLTSRGDGRSAIDSSLVVSMEINGVMYQGVLFAQTPTSRHPGNP